MNRKTLLSAIVCLVVVGCGKTGEETHSPKNHQQKQSNLSISEEEKQLRQEEVNRYLEIRQQGWEIVESQTSSSGQIFDYVTTETLYPNSPAAPFSEPPPIDITMDNGQSYHEGLTEGEELAITEFEEEGLQAPSGTIPVLRPSFTNYVEGKTPPNIDTLEKFLKNNPKPKPNGLQNNRLYVGYFSSNNNTGTAGTINLWYYKEGTTNKMMLNQAAIASQDRSESVEAGFQVSGNNFDDLDLHFFVYSTTDTYQTDEDYIGGYAHLHKGFVQYKHAKFPVGAKFKRTSLSKPGEIQKICNVRIQLYRGNWWIAACGSWIGFYPTQNSHTVDSSERMPYRTLNTKANFSGWYGEAFDDTPKSWMPFDMGSGLLPQNQFGRDAYMRGFIERREDPENGGWHLKNTWRHYSGNIQPFISNGNCYNGSNMLSLAYPGWHRYAYLGGPGRNSKCI